LHRERLLANHDVHRRGVAHALATVTHDEHDEDVTLAVSTDSTFTLRGSSPGAVPCDEAMLARHTNDRKALRHRRQFGLVRFIEPW
jgi:hypothetical protein